MKNLSRFLVLSATLAVAAAAQAQLLNVQGNTVGTFNFTQNAGGLTFTNGLFNTFVVTDGSTPASLSDTDLGVFSLVNVPGGLDQYIGTFNLAVTFTVPNTTPGSSTYTALLSGAVRTVPGQGTTSSVMITFDDDGDLDPLTVKKSFTYVAVDGTSGNLSLALDRQYSVNVNRPNDISGQLTATAVPGPSALASFGIAGIGALRRRRRSLK